MRLRKKKSLLDQASDYVDSVRPQVESAVAQAREALNEFVEDTARPALNDAREKAGPALHDARGRASTYAHDARTKAAPVAAAGMALAAEKATSAKEAADARVAALKGEPPKKKGGKLKKLALFTAVAAVVGVVAKKLQGGSTSDNWQSSYVPAPPPAGPTSPAAPGAPTVTSEEDPGGASPDEAIADQAEGAHRVTTPDDPADVVAIDEQRDH